MPAHDTIGGRAPDIRLAAAPPATAGAAERAALAQFEDRVPVVIARQRRRQATLNREARDHAASSAERP